MDQKTITIFGSSLPKPGEKEYEDAYYIANQLAKSGFDICSGGSLGIMDAVSKAARNEGRKAIGVTVKIFESKSSSNLSHEIKCDTLFERLDNLINLGDAYIVLPGGTGTLLEISLVWELMNKNILDNKPIACLGEMWKNMVDPMEKRVKWEKRKENLVSCFDDKNDLIQFIKNSFQGEK